MKNRYSAGLTSMNFQTCYDLMAYESALLSWVPYMDRNYWNHICNSLRNKRRPGAPPRANLDGTCPLLHSVYLHHIQQQQTPQVTPWTWTISWISTRTEFPTFWMRIWRMTFMWLSHTWVLHPGCTSHSTPSIPWNDTTTPYLKARENQPCPRRCIGSTFESVCCGTCFTSPCLFYFSVWVPYHCFREKRIFNPLSILASFFSQIWVFRVWAFCRYVSIPSIYYNKQLNNKQIARYDREISSYV